MLEFEIAHRTPEVIAEEIRQIKDEVQGAVINGTIEIGKRLCEAKEMVAVGSWGQWLKDNVSYSERTAQNAMAIYNEYGKKGVPAGLTNASITNALQLIGLPEDIKHELIDSGAAEEMSSRELKERIRELEKERDEAQLRIEDLAGALQAEEDESREALDRVAQLTEANAKLRNAAVIAAENETKAIQESMAASQKAIREAERRKELELELEKKQTQMAMPTVMEPAIIKEDTEETKQELARLRDRLSKQRSEAEIRFEDAYTDLVEQINYCVALGEQIGAERGQSAFKQCMRRLHGVMLSTGNQLAGNC